jgi:hypothetical protein
MALTNFKKIQPEAEFHDDGRCKANGCPMRGSVNFGGGWLCSYHSQGESHDWPRVTEALINADDIRLAIDEVLKIDAITWAERVNGHLPRWMEFERLFDHKPELQPQGREKELKTKYEYRLRNELAILAGLQRRTKA